MQHTFDHMISFFKGPTATSPVTRESKVDVEQQKMSNIFHNNVLYFQKCKDLEEKVDYLQKLNSFLISQILQSMSSSKPEGSPNHRVTEPVRKKSLKFEDDRCLNKTFQLYKIYKGLLDSGGQTLEKISGMFFPPNFDFEYALYTKHHQKIINLLLKSSINSIISLRDEVKTAKLSSHKLAEKMKSNHDPYFSQHSLLMKPYELNSDKSNYSRPEPAKADSDPGEKAMRIVGATGERSLVQHTLSDNLSISQNKLGIIEDPMFSDSFLNATDIKNHLLRPFQLEPEFGKADKSVQVNGPDYRSLDGSDSNHFSVV